MSAKEQELARYVNKGFTVTLSAYYSFDTNRIKYPITINGDLVSEANGDKLALMRFKEIIEEIEAN